MNLDVGRQATAAEISLMRERLDQALQEGCGSAVERPVLSAGDGATTDEVAEVAEPLASGTPLHGHMRDESEDILKSMTKPSRSAAVAGARIVVSHHKCAGRSNFGRMKETLPKFSEA